MGRIVIRSGYDIVYDCAGPTPMHLLLSVRPERVADLVTPEVMTADPPVELDHYTDLYGNRATRLLAPGGLIRFSADFLVADDGEPDSVAPDAMQHPVETLPKDVLVYLLGSRYCETDRLVDEAWKRFGAVPPGWERVAAICDFVHGHVTFGYPHARPTRTAEQAMEEGVGVCRDFAHLAVALCRCMNIPARYVTGYMGDIREPPALPMDFSAWFEAWLGGRWYVFDARHNRPRIGRIPMAVGRDAADTAIGTNFGPVVLTRFDVISDEVDAP
jgi:transglutaminase-like putative cysteine protease